MSARDELRDCFLSDSRDRFEAAADAYRTEVLAKAIGRLRAVPVQCTALTGPVWYGAGWKDAISTLEDIADYQVPDYEAYPGELVRLRALALQLRAHGRQGNWERVDQLLGDHAASDRTSRDGAKEKASADAAPTATPQPEAEQSGEWAAADALRGRLADLLAHIREDPRRAWTTTNVRNFYLSRAPKRTTCRRDLAALAAMGWLVEHDDEGRRYFTFNTRKDRA